MRYVCAISAAALIMASAVARLIESCHLDRVVPAASAAEPDRSAKDAAKVADRSPIALALTPDEKWLVTANQTAGTVSLVDVEAGTIAAELPCGTRPSGIAISPDGRRVLVSAMESGELS